MNERERILYVIDSEIKQEHEVMLNRQTQTNRRHRQLPYLYVQASFRERRNLIRVKVQLYRARVCLCFRFRKKMSTYPAFQIFWLSLWRKEGLQCLLNTRICFLFKGVQNVQFFDSSLFDFSFLPSFNIEILK